MGPGWMSKPASSSSALIREKPEDWKELRVPEQTVGKAESIQG